MSTSTKQHPCLAYYTSSSPLPLLPNEGMILSTGNPLHFISPTTDENNAVTSLFSSNWGNGNVQSTNWYASGDLELDQFLLEQQQQQQQQKSNNNNPSAQKTYDACALEFEFRCLPNDNEAGTTTPSGSSSSHAKVSFTYNFASEEYYQLNDNAAYSDAFAFFLNGQNIATLPTTAAAAGEDQDSHNKSYVGMDTINKNTNEEYFIDNDEIVPGVATSGGVQYPYLEADGLTVQLSASGTVDTIATIVDISSGSSTTTTASNTKGSESGWNTMKIVIADVGDRMLDSWIVLQGGSFKCRQEMIVMEEEEGEEIIMVSSLVVEKVALLLHSLPACKKIQYKMSLLESDSWLASYHYLLSFVVVASRYVHTFLDRRYCTYRTAIGGQIMV